MLLGVLRPDRIVHLYPPGNADNFEAGEALGFKPIVVLHFGYSTTFLAALDVAKTYEAKPRKFDSAT